jgi:hypothetical protein
MLYRDKKGWASMDKLSLVEKNRLENISTMAKTTLARMIHFIWT